MNPQALPTENNHFKARYAPWLGLGLLALGIFNLALAILLIFLNGGFNAGLVTGAVLTVVGYLYLTRPYFSLAPNRLTIYNLVGSPVKRYSFESFNDIAIESNVVYLESGALTPRHKEKLKLTKWMVRGADWKKFCAMTEPL
ncbi:MAG: hypothetical protein AAFY33_03745 [Cyanobacteria bacterium J06643_4]